MGESKPVKAKVSRKPTNKELPKEWLENNTWRRTVIPSLIRWAAIQPNPWLIPDARTLQALLTICAVVYGDHNYTIVTQSNTFRLVCMCRVLGFEINMSY